MKEKTPYRKLHNFITRKITLKILTGGYNYFSGVFVNSQILTLFLTYI